MYELGQGHAQAAAYARKLGLGEATMCVFVPVEEEVIPKEVPGELTGGWREGRGRGHRVGMVRCRPPH